MRTQLVERAALVDARAEIVFAAAAAAAAAAAVAVAARACRAAILSSLWGASPASHTQTEHGSEARTHSSVGCESHGCCCFGTAGSGRATGSEICPETKPI